jgi:Family of unknown function (DUF5681)
MTEHNDDDDRVGYGRPPKRTRFKPGQSGNPRGRKPKVDYSGWKNPIQKYLLEPMTITINGKRQELPTVDVLMMSTIKRALDGSSRHLKILLDGAEGLKALLQEEKRQMTMADQEYIEEVWETSKQWLPGAIDEPKKENGATDVPQRQSLLSTPGPRPIAKKRPAARQRAED